MLGRVLRRRPQGTALDLGRGGSIGWVSCVRLGAAGLPAAAATGARVMVAWGNEAVVLPALGVAPRFYLWGAEEVVIDVWRHAVYAAVSGVAYDLLR